jgi:hypothetical protein
MVFEKGAGTALAGKQGTFLSIFLILSVNRRVFSEKKEKNVPP